MIAGHFGFAAGAKAREGEVPLWALMLACQWLDVVFVPLFATGRETIGNVAGSSGGYGAVLIHADYTHSLVGALALSALFGAVAGLRWGRRSAVVLGVVAFSHWILDLLVHRADMPILPGNAGDLPRLGFGLWRVPAVSAVVELLLVVVGGALYWRAAKETVAKQAGSGKPDFRTAHLAGFVVVASGVLTLALNLMGD
jgi:hypothetical protein